MDWGLVLEARKVEKEYFKRMGVYDVVSSEEQKKTGGKVIDLKWIDTNKGDNDCPDVRSRLVGRVFKEGKDDSLYAPTPHLRP